MLNRPQNAQLKNAKPLEFPPDDYLREIIETPEKFTRKAHEIHYLSSLVFYQIESADYLLIDAEHMKLSLKLQQPTLRFVISKKLAEEMSRTGVIKKSSGDNPTFWNVRFSVEPDPRTDGKYIGRVYWTELVNIRDVVLSGGAAGKTRFEDLNWRPK